MVAKKASTPKWGDQSSSAKPGAAKTPAAEPADDLEIPEFLRRSKDAPAQTDIEVAIPQPAVETSPEQPEEPPHDPETGELVETTRADGGADIVTRHTNIAEPAEPAEELEPQAHGGALKPTRKAAPGEFANATTEGVNLSNMNGALISFVERVERLTEEIKAIQDDRKEVFAEMKASGFDVTIVREAIRRRAKDPAVIAEHDAMLDLYEEALR